VDLYQGPQAKSFSLLHKIKGGEALERGGAENKKGEKRKETRAKNTM
jgi:hypothetical protein